MHIELNFYINHVWLFWKHVGHVFFLSHSSFPAFFFILGWYDCLHANPLKHKARPSNSKLWTYLSKMIWVNVLMKTINTKTFKKNNETIQNRKVNLTNNRISKENSNQDKTGSKKLTKSNTNCNVLRLRVANYCLKVIL